MLSNYQIDVNALDLYPLKGGPYKHPEQLRIACYDLPIATVGTHAFSETDGVEEDYFPNPKQSSSLRKRVDFCKIILGEISSSTKVLFLY